MLFCTYAQCALIELCQAETNIDYTYTYIVYLVQSRCVISAVKFHSFIDTFMPVNTHHRPN